MNVRRATVLMLFGITLAAALGACTAGDAVTVYTAASMTDVVEAAAAEFGETTGDQVLVRTGSSGMLATEIENGAPADIFVSANPSWTDRLVERGLYEKGAVRVLAWNTLVTVVPVDMDEELMPVNFYLLAELDRIAMGDPRSVPAGNYARQAMESLGIRPQLEGKLVESPDVRAVLALVERGEVGAGIVYATDARASEKVKVAFTFPESSHEVIAYTAGLLKDAPHPGKARAFLDFLSGPEGVRLLSEHGFTGFDREGTN